MFGRDKSSLPEPGKALPGRAERPWHLATRHAVLEAPLVTDEVPEGHEVALGGLGSITTEIKPAPTYYYAEDPHQQYLAKNPFGYRCHANTGVRFPQTA